MKAVFATLFLAAILVSHPVGQDAPPTFRVGAELVVVDLVAVDGRGQFVADLQPSEIQLREDGRPQKIQFLKRVGRGTPPAGSVELRPGSVESVPSTAPGAPASESAAASDVSVAIVLDLLSMPLDAVPRIREALLQLVKAELPAGIPVMVATMDRQLVIRQAFTTRRELVTAAIDALPPAVAGGIAVSNVFDQLDQLCHVSNSTRFAEAGIEAGKSLIREANARSRITSANLSMLAQSLAPVPGRKHVILYSAGYAISPASQAIDAVVAGLTACSTTDMMRIRRQVAGELASLDTSDAATGIRAVVDRANRSQVSFYAVDPRGLTTSVVQPQERGRSRIGGGGPMVKLSGLNADVSRDYLERVAVDTGGRTFFDSNDIANGLRRGWQDADAYYLMGYVPDVSRAKGRFRKMSAATTRPDVELRYRQGYYEWTESELAAQDIEQALLAPGAFNREGFNVATGIEGRLLKIVVGIPPAAVRFTAAGGEHRADLSVHGELRDASGALVGGKPLPGRDIALRVNDERLAAMRAADHLRVFLETPVPPPGTYTLAVVARDSSGWIAVRTLPVLIERQ